jgi:hypothetical protein
MRYWRCDAVNQIQLSLKSGSDDAELECPRRQCAYATIPALVPPTMDENDMAYHGFLASDCRSERWGSHAKNVCSLGF